MSIKSILLPIDDMDRNQYAIELAGLMADRLDAHLTGLAVTPPLQVPVFSPEVMPQAMYDGLVSARQQHMAAISSAFHQKMQGNGQQDRSDFISSDLPLSDTIARISCYYDLIVARQELMTDEDDTWRGMPGNLIARSGAPVLLTPWIGLPKTTAQKVMIAWNGSQQATRAARAALPILQQAEEVTVVTCNNTHDIPAADFATWLSRHDVRAETLKEVAQDIEIADMLLNDISDAGHDFLVMGAYGHWRLRELILGGTTSHILRHMTVPVLFCH